MITGKQDKGYRSPWGEGSPIAKKEPEEKKPRTAVVLAGFLIIAAIAGGVYYFYFRAPAPENVGLEFSKSSQILAGDPFTLTVSFSNYSGNVLKNAKISLLLPDGISFLGFSRDQRVSEQAVGDLGPGSINQQSFNLIAQGGGNVSRRVEAKLAYSTDQNPGAQFEYSSNTDLVVGSPAVILNLTAPQSVFNGQDFQIKADYANNTGHDYKGVMLKMDYPPIFQFKNSTVQPEGAGNNSWDLGTVAAGASGSILITGDIVGPEKSFINFNALLTADFLGQTYDLNSQSASVGISSAPLSLDISLTGGGADNIPAPGDTLDYSLNYKNNSGVAMQNVTISAKLVGEMFDLATLQTNAAASSLNNTLTWLAANTPEFANVPPGGTGSVDFRIKVKPSFPIRLLSDKNYTLKVQAQIESPTVPPGTTADKTISVANSEVKIAGKMTVAAEAYWRDAKSGILNSGPYPPKVNKATQYTIHWKLVNYATDATNVVVSAYLQSGSKFTGAVKSSLDISPSYDPAGGLVTWSIPYLPATRGVISPPAEAVFQIENTPAINQLGQSAPLLGETNAEWTDAFVGEVMQASAVALDTSLPYDKTISASNRVVQQ